MVLDDIPFVTIRATHCVLCGNIPDFNSLFIRERIPVKPQPAAERPLAVNSAIHAPGLISHGNAKQRLYVAASKQT